METPGEQPRSASIRQRSTQYSDSGCSRYLLNLKTCRPATRYAIASTTRCTWRNLIWYTLNERDRRRSGTVATVSHNASQIAHGRSRCAIYTHTDRLYHAFTLSPVAYLDSPSQETMTSIRTLAQVVPDWQSTAHNDVSASYCWQNELVPAQELPVVDLSVSIRSRVFRGKWLARMTSCMRHGRLMLSVFVTGAVLVIAMFVVQDVVVAQVLGIVSAMLMLPSSFIGFSVLRFDIVRLLLQTYDFWFFFLFNLGAVVVVSAQFSDMRIIASIMIWAGTVVNILVDANLRGAKAMVFINFIMVLSGVVYIAALKTKLMVSIREFVIVRYNAHELPAEASAVTCVVTNLAMIMRNVGRSRQALQRGGLQQVNCVSYRSTLRLVRGPRAVLSNAADLLATGHAAAAPIENSDETATISPVQQLRCILPVKTIDARKTIWPLVTDALYTKISGFRPVYLLVRWSGLGIFVFAVVAASQADYSTTQSTSFERVPVVELTATALTGVFVVMSGMTYHVALFKSLLGSFDFVYLSSQLTLIHVTACDFFQWRSSPSVIVLTCWLWIHWVLCGDALSPLVKHAVRGHVRFPAIVTSTCAIAGAALLYRLVVLDTSPVPFDRVLWDETVLGNHVQVRLMPLFYNSLANVALWLIRLLYRVWTFDSDALVVLDAPVAYDNYMMKAQMHQQHGRAAARQRIWSRQWKRKSGSRTASISKK